jgi:hypothetical protein
VDTITGALLLGKGYRRTLPIALKSVRPFVQKMIVYVEGFDDSLALLNEYVTYNDKTEQYHLARPEFLKMIKQEGNLDFANFRNECIKQCETPWILMFDADEFWHTDNTPESFWNMLNSTQEKAFRIRRFNEPFAPDWPDLQTRIIRCGSGYYYRPLHEMFPDVHAPILDGFLIIHMLKPRSLLIERDKKFIAADVHTQGLHMARPEIQQRVKDEYECAPQG